MKQSLKIQFLKKKKKKKKGLKIHVKRLIFPLSILPLLCVLFLENK